LIDSNGFLCIKPHFDEGDLVIAELAVAKIERKDAVSIGIELLQADEEALQGGVLQGLVERLAGEFLLVDADDRPTGGKGEGVAACQVGEAGGAIGQVFEQGAVLGTWAARRRVVWLGGGW
jgi:hypothetical protein